MSSVIVRSFFGRGRNLCLCDDLFWWRYGERFARCGACSRESRSLKIVADGCDLVERSLNITCDVAGGFSIFANPFLNIACFRSNEIFTILNNFCLTCFPDF